MTVVLSLGPYPAAREMLALWDGRSEMHVRYKTADRLVRIGPIISLQRFGARRKYSEWQHASPPYSGMETRHAAEAVPPHAGAVENHVFHVHELS